MQSDDIIAITAENGVGSGTTVECVVGGIVTFDEKGVITVATVQMVVARATNDSVIAAGPGDRVIAGAGIDVIYVDDTPYRDGTTHVVFKPLDLIARLVALVPKPRVNFTRYHGVFAPNSHLRAQVTPGRRARRTDDDCMDAGGRATHGAVAETAEEADRRPPQDTRP